MMDRTLTYIDAVREAADQVDRDRRSFSFRA
jgi:hypothetical protein